MNTNPKFEEWANLFCAMFDVEQTPLVIPTLVKLIEFTVFEAEFRAQKSEIVEAAGDKHPIDCPNLHDKYTNVSNMVSFQGGKNMMMENLLSQHEQIETNILKTFKQLVIDHFVTNREEE